jgi:hypothetical protein
MHPPDPYKARSPVTRQSDRAKSQKSSEKQKRTYTIPADVQVFLLALLPLFLSAVCTLALWGPR